MKEQGRYRYNVDYEIATAMIDAEIGFNATTHQGRHPDDYWVADPLKLARDLAHLRRLFGPDDHDTIQAVLTLTRALAECRNRRSPYPYTHPDLLSPDSPPGLTDDGPLLEPARLDEVFDESIRPILYGDLAGVDRPSVHFIGGQPGAGKSQVNGRLERALARRDGEGTVASIAIDRYRDFHPYWEGLLTEDRATAGARVNHDCWRWSHKARDVVLEMERPPHVIHESSLRNPADALADAPRYKERGFTAELHVIGVPSMVSRVRYLRRFLREVDSLAPGRLIPEKMHDEAFDRLPDSVGELVASGQFDAVTIYDANGNPFHRLVQVSAERADTVANLVGDLQDRKRIDCLRLHEEWVEAMALANALDHAEARSRLEALGREIDHFAEFMLPGDEFWGERPRQQGRPMTHEEEMAYEMPDDYVIDWSKAFPNPHAKYLNEQITLSLPYWTFDHFSAIAERTGLSLQRVIAYYLQPARATGFDLTLDPPGITGAAFLPDFPATPTATPTDGAAQTDEDCGLGAGQTDVLA
jgi:hypothetical protein